MSDIINATYNFIDILDKSDLMRELTSSREILMKNKTLLNEIASIKRENDNKVIIEKRKAIYENKDYKKYMECYNELSLIIMKINKKYAEYTKTKEHSHHE